MRAGEEGFHPGCCHPPLEAHSQIPQDVGFGDAVDDGAGGRTTEAWIDDDALCRPVAGLAPHQFLFADRTWGTTGDAGSCEVPANGVSAGPQIPSAAIPISRWKDERFVGLRAEETVDPTCVEAEVLQFGLQSCDVVAGQRRRSW